VGALKDEAGRFEDAKTGGDQKSQNGRPNKVSAKF